MTLANLGREMARRYVDMLPIAEWANALLVFLRVPLATRRPAHVRRRRAAPSRASRHGVGSHAEPVALVGECSVPVV